MTYDLPTEQSGVTKIAVIGAGVSGLAQIQQLVEAWRRDSVGTQLELVVFESKKEVGGVWLTEGKPKRSVRTHLPAGAVEQVYSYPLEHEDPSPMYEGLWTNLAHDLMSFRGFPFPEDTPLFPDQPRVQKYLEAFADAYSLRDHIRFNTRVERVYLTPSPGPGPGKESKRWTIVSSSNGPAARASEGSPDSKVETFDYVVVANGHYSDGWIPAVPGLSSYPGQLIHSRFFLRASDYVGQSVLVVGSFASGGDISRLIASLNVGKYDSSGEPVDGHPREGFTKVWVSSSGANPYSASEDGPWAQYITNVPLIERVDPPSPAYPRGLIHFQPTQVTSPDGSVETVTHEALEAPATIIYATGYNFHYPFFKAGDAPWSDPGVDLVDGAVREGERQGGDRWEEGGLKGQGIRGLDELMLFLKGDRTIAFPVLPYQVVPFPLAQVQARLISLLWAGLLPSFPAHPSLPPNPSNPFSRPQSAKLNGDGPDAGGPFDTPESDPASPETANAVEPRPGPEKPRKVLEKMRELVFGAEYEWTYSEFLMGLMAEADAGGAEVKEHWKRIEQWRRDRRADTSLRKRTLGY